ncbi:MAG TPA: response regulator transcription factor [Armatimonadetes bacterium]|jgi:DNA-binding response OmpR family regulator|nr:response regulator transcription factor [Armatimonadota bacterium]
MAAGSPRILVVDDEPAIVEGLCEALELMGYQVQTAFNGQQALEAVDQVCPDLIVLDVLMPRMDGLQTLEILRGKPATRDTPIILLTALGSDMDIIEGIKAGATMYLTKPAEISKVVSLISAILGRRRALEGESAGSLHPVASKR